MQPLPDTPIASPEQDLFQLSPFAARLARVVRGSQLRDNMVVGLNGGAGTGKTSTINMMVAWLMAQEYAGLDPFSARDRDEREAMDTLLRDMSPAEQVAYLADLELGWGAPGSGGQTVIVRYNPWLLSGHETLLSDFFRLFGERLGQTLRGEAQAGIRAAAARLADFIDLSQRSTSGFSRLIALSDDAANAAAPGGASGKRAGFLKGLMRKSTVPSPLTLKDARDLLRAELAQLTAVNSRVLVIIEDIDRLRPDEIRPLLALMKTTGDLPNVTYLVSYDRAALARALGDDGTAREALPDLLEKIVQVDLDLPRVAPERLLEALVAHADDLFGASLSEAERLDLLASFERGHGLLQSPRDVTRLRNALAFTDAATGRSLRTTDLIRIEMIRLKERAVFDWMIRNAVYFHPRVGLPLADFPGGEKVFVEEGLALAGWVNREAVGDALSRTFETVARAIGGPAVLPRDRLHDLDTRYPLASWEGWECYLRSFPGAEVISQEEWLYLRQIWGDLAKSRSYVQTLVSRRRPDGKPMLVSFLGSLDRLPTSSSPPIGLLNALLELQDNLVEIGFGLSPRSALRALHHLLARCSDPDEVLLGMIMREGVNPLAVLVLLEVFAEQLGLMSKGKPREHCIINEEGLVQAVATVYLRMGSVPADRVAEWFGTVAVHRLLMLGVDRKTLLLFSQKLLTTSSDRLRYFLQDVCSTWPTRHGVVHMLTRRPEADFYPLGDMRNYAAKMLRKSPQDVFFREFVKAADEFLAIATLRDRTDRVRAQLEGPAAS